MSSAMLLKYTLIVGRPVIRLAIGKAGGGIHILLKPDFATGGSPLPDE
jgi:hypothetical protein